MRFGIIVFPGTWSDTDCYHAVKGVLQQEAEYVWHKEDSLAGYDCVILPGGFSYGDYLRAGAMARFSPVMDALNRFADSGRPVIGICNGFQILCEAGLLPGALMRNASQNFICRTVALKVENDRSLFTSGYAAGQTIDIPVAHHDGNYFADDETLDMLEGEGRVAFRYVENCNGSQRDIAGVLNAEGNVLGMMPHPERAVEQAHGGTDGLALFENAIKTLVSA